MNTAAAPAEAYPLYWPDGRPRSRQPQRSPFKVEGFSRIRDELVNQLKLIGAQHIVISTNVAVRRDGLPLAGQRQPNDTGVAVYFTRNGRQLCFACDRWTRVDDNLWAIAKTIEALRGINRWGTGDMIESAFKGFAALPAGKPWHQVLGLTPDATADQIDEAYRREVFRRHPDRGGSTDLMHELTEAMRQVNGTPRPS